MKRKTNPMWEATKQVSELRTLCREGRRVCGMSLRELSEASGVSTPTLSRFENGREITATHYWAILFSLLPAVSAKVRKENKRKAALEFQARKRKLERRAALAPAPYPDGGHLPGERDSLYTDKQVTK